MAAPDDTLALVTLDAHRHGELTAASGHVHSGVPATGMRRTPARAGFEVERCEVTSRGRRAPNFDVITAFATKPRRAQRRVA